MAGLIVGCHLSASKGFMHMGEETVRLGGSTFQFFTRNPRGGKAREIDEEDISAFLGYAEEHGFGKIVAHAPYTVNACSKDEKTREFARETLADDIRRMEYLPGNYYNFHPGSHVGQGVPDGIRYIAEALNEVLLPGQTTTVLLETMAGKGTEIGRSFEEIRQIIDSVELSGHLGVCLDTCHVYDAGYDIVGNLDGVLKEFDDVIGLSRLKAVHINDSKNPFGSHKDRHEKLGEGSLGEGFFKSVATHPILSGLPLILETPNDNDGYAEEIALMRRFAGEGADSAT